MRAEQILIIRFSAIGDVAMAVPVVYSLAKQYPDLRITFMSKAFARPLFENLAPNVGFMEADLKEEYNGIRGLNALYRRLTSKNFTAIADFHDVLRSKYLRTRFNIDRYKVAHINKHRNGRKKLVAVDNKQLVQLPTSFHNYAEVLAELGYPVKVEFKSFFPEGKGDLSKLPVSFVPKKDADEYWIGVAPFAAHQGKIYPPRLMEKVIAGLINRYPESKIYLFGGGDKEIKVFDEWCGKYKQLFKASPNLAGLYQELILMSHLDVMISMDSANMHLASLVNTPVVSVWGATHPFAGFMGWNQSLDNAVQLDLPCRPCSIYGDKECIRGNYACMKNIAPDNIINKVIGVIEKKRI